MNMRSRQQILPAFAVFAVTFSSWLGMRWYQSSQDVSATLSTDTAATVSADASTYRCDCSCGSRRDTVARYGEALEPEQASACIQYNGVRCTTAKEPLLAYSNCGLAGKEVEGGVIEPVR